MDEKAFELFTKKAIEENSEAIVTNLVALLTGQKKLTLTTEFETYGVEQDIMPGTINNAHRMITTVEVK